MAKTEVTLGPIRVMWVKAEGGLSGVGDAWSTLESKLPSLKGRKFYGTFHNNTYRACVAIIDEKEAETLGLPTATIPEGKYARQKVADYRSRVEVIAETFEALAKECCADRSRPEVEFYKSQSEIILLLPIL
jgi:uncharacterized membrane protein